jgi:hypothetical protein
VEVANNAWNVTQDFARNNPRLINTAIDATSVALVAFDIANSFVSPGPDAVFFAASLQASKIGGKQAIKEEITVIGRVKNLQNLKSGERSLLDRLPDQGSPKANWRQNSGVLRREMSKGQPIRDASPGDTAGQFLNAERNLLRDRGWTFDPKTSNWIPPKP